MRMEDFSTERLEVVHWGEQLENAAGSETLKQEIVELLTPAVLEFLPAELSVPGGEDGIEEWIEEREQSSEVYLVRETGPNPLLGLLFLIILGEDDAEDEEDEPARGVASGDEDASQTMMIGYIIAENAWGCGFASELVGGVMGGLDEIGNPTVRGGVASDNDASARVLTKNGFSLVEALSSDDLDMYEA